MRVMGIDPGLTRLGFGIIDDAGRKLSAIAEGTIVTPAGGSTAERLLQLSDALTETISTHAPEALSIERLFFNLNAKTAVPVVQASGVAMLAAAKAGVEVHEYTPLEVKSAVAGTGTASKDQVRFMVSRLLSMRGKAPPADAADALAIAICHLHSRKLRAVEEATR